MESCGSRWRTRHLKQWTTCSPTTPPAAQTSPQLQSVRRALAQDRPNFCAQVRATASVEPSVAPGSVTAPQQSRRRYIEHQQQQKAVWAQQAAAQAQPQTLQQQRRYQQQAQQGVHGRIPASIKAAVPPGLPPPLLSHPRLHQTTRESYLSSAASGRSELGV